MIEKRTAIVLQGGGALGAYELGVLKRLDSVPGFKLDVISGVSIGAINAVTLAGARGDKPLRTLEALWDDFSVTYPPFIPDAMKTWLPLFGSRNFYGPRIDLEPIADRTHFYDTTPLRQALDRFVDFDRLADGRPAVVVTAVDVETGAIMEFDNDNPAEPLTVEHVMASASLPPGFPMTHVGGHACWDGGLFDNTPLKPAIRRLRAYGDVPKRLVVVELFPRRGSIPRTMPEVFDRVFEMIFSNRCATDLETAARVNGLVEFKERIDDLLDAADPDKANAVRGLPLYEHLGKYRSLEIIRITNRHPELVSAPFDFSRDGIRRRVEAGYHDADAALSGGTLAEVT